MAFYKKDQHKHSPTKSPYKKQIIQIAKLARYQPIPSILPQHNDFNFTVLEDGHLRRKIKQEVHTANIESSQIIQNHKRQYSPSYPYHSRNSPKMKKIEHHPTNASENIEHFVTVDTRIDSQEPLIVVSNKKIPQDSLLTQSEARLFLQKEREMKMKQDKRNYNSVQGKQRYSRIYEQEEDQSEGETEYEYDGPPGPGYYSFNTSTFQESKVSRSTANNTRASNFSFGSKAERFILNPQKQKPVNDSRVRRFRKKEELKKNKLKENLLQKSHKKIVPFNSKSPKFSPQPREEFPSPQDYRIRYGIEEELIRKIQRNFKGNFGVMEQRFKEDSISNLGPGCYDVPEQEYKPQINQNSYFFASQQKRFS